MTKLLYLLELIVLDKVDKFDTFEHRLSYSAVLFRVTLTRSEGCPKQVQCHSAVFATIET